MIGKRYIDGDKLLERMGDQPLTDITKIVAGWLKRQPKMPKLVSRQGAAKILGKHTSHLRRMEDRLPEPIYIEGNSWPFYLHADIVALKKELDQEEAEKRKSAAAATS